MLAFDPRPVLSHVHVTNPSQTATLETEICGQRLSTARAANEPRRRSKKLSRPTAAPQAAGMSCYSVAEEIMPGRADFLVERGEFEPEVSLAVLPRTQSYRCLLRLERLKGQ